MNRRKNIFIILSITTIIMLISCNNTETEHIENNYMDLIPEKDEKAYIQAKLIFYSLPSPVETAMIIETANVQYYEEVLNSTNKANSYLTTKEMAINLGVYSADLSYISIFEKRQATINYLVVTKKLAEKLNILDIVSDSTIQSIRKNILDKNKVYNIISETFMNSNAYLQENNRTETASFIVLGGWIEGLYISTQLVGDSIKNNPKLVQIIYEQRFSLDDLIGLLEIYKNNDDISVLLTSIKELKAIFNKMQEPISQEQFDLLSNKVKTIRNDFVK